MALDSAAKRASVVGVGRPWLRGQTPDSGLGEPWRHSVGNAYAAFTFQVPVAASTLGALTAAVSLDAYTVGVPSDAIAAEVSGDTVTVGVMPSGF